MSCGGSLLLVGMNNEIYITIQCPQLHVLSHFKPGLSYILLSGDG